MTKFKMGDKVEVVIKQSGNFIIVGSWGYVVEIDIKRTFNDDDGYLYPIKVDYQYIPNSITNKEQKEKDSYKGIYWTREERLKLISKKITNWEKEIEE